jgi:hypothetical protein
MTPRCPICDRPLSRVELLLAQRDAHFECRFCWNRIHMNGSNASHARARRDKSQISNFRSSGPARGRK